MSFPKEADRKVYEALGDYFRIQEGQGKDIVHNFELTDFYSLASFLRYRYIMH